MYISAHFPAAAAPTRRGSLIAVRPSAVSSMIPETPPPVRNKTCVRITKIRYEAHAPDSPGVFKWAWNVAQNLEYQLRPAHGFRCAAIDINRCSPHGFDIVCEGESAKRHLARFHAKVDDANAVAFTLPNGLSVNAASILSKRLRTAGLTAALHTRRVGKATPEEHINLRQFTADINSRAGREALIAAMAGIARSVRWKSEVVVTAEEASYPRLRATFERVPIDG